MAAQQSNQQEQTPRIVITHRRLRAQCFTENLGNNVGLEMVLIPGGSFVMGAPEAEEGSDDSERPQRTVSVSPFLMGQYPVTQAQWQAVASLPQVKRKLNPEPSSFKGDDLPVEQVTWFDAVEFCDRLSEHTNRPYRLPSEAEWEYACRAGTTTPFHFGETITTDLANYRGTDWEIEDTTYPGFYGKGPRGIYRKKTTPVGSFGVANAFGLYDMHGNVLEWCLDHWHSNYEGAPTDGSAWLTEGENSPRLRRGGSWYFGPGYCRSAYRGRYDPVNLNVNVGLRGVCAASRTL